MNPSPMNQSRICTYGVSSTLTYAYRQRRKVDPKKSYVTNGAGAIQEFTIDGQRYLVVGVANDHYIVRCPDRTYGKVCPKTRTFLGAY